MSPMPAPPARGAVGKPGRAAAVAALLGALFAGSALPAGASLAAGAASTSSVSSAQWGADPAATSVTAAPNCQASPSPCGPFQASGSGPWYFNVWNTGSVALTGMSYVISFTGGTLPTVTVTACSVAWTGGTIPTCSGTSTTVISNATAGTYPVTVAVPAAPASAVYLEAATLGSPSATTVSVTVSSGSPRQIRAAATTGA